MNLVTALIVDDEEHNRNVLKTLLTKHCPTVQVIGEAKNVDEAFTLLHTEKPQLLFLDVKMPNKSGFDLLKMFETIDFEVIFVSAFNEFAVTAFEFNAIGYILKPIDYHKLIIGVNKAILKISLRQKNEGVVQFIKTLEPKTDSIAQLAVHHHEKVVLVNIKNVISIQSNEGICQLKLIDNKQYHSTKDLKLFEGILKEIGNFVRISKNIILNLDFLKSYEKGELCVLQMQNGDEFEVSRRKKAEVLSKIKLI
jgi:two-component system LytT family response regulator